MKYREKLMKSKQKVLQEMSGKKNIYTNNDNMK